MEYYKNLLTKRKTSKVQIIFGVLFIILSCLWIFVKKYEGKPIVGFDWFYSIIFFLNGIVNILEGKGIQINKIFGDAFIRITEKEIIYKPKTISKAIRLSWEEISEIMLKTSQIEILGNDNKNIELQYNKLDYTSVVEIKDLIANIAQTKKVLIKV